MKLIKKMLCTLLILALLVFAFGCQAAPEATTTGEGGVIAASSTPEQNLAPAPELTTLESLPFLDYSGEEETPPLFLMYKNQEGEWQQRKLPAAFAGGSATLFASQKVLAASASSTQNSLSVAVSHNDGESWAMESISLAEQPAPEGEPIRCVAIGFTTENNGWLVAAAAQSDVYFLYTTGSGGASWQFAQSMQLPYANANFTFASSVMGWAYFNYTSGIEKEIPQVFETFDGGASWQPASIEIPAEAQAGTRDFFVWKVAWNGTQWEMFTSALKDVGYPNLPDYTFLLDLQGAAWRLSLPEWALPPGTSQVAFTDYVENYMYPVLEYDANQGLTDADAITWTIFDAADWQYRTTGEDLTGKTIPYALINTMAEYEYGISNFDVAFYAEAVTANGSGLAKAGDGFYYDGHWPKNEGITVSILQTAVLSDGTIEAFLAYRYFDSGSMGVDEFEEAYIPPTAKYVRCILKPANAEGVPFFSLLFAEEIAKPGSAA